MGRILIVEDNETLREGMVEVLKDAGHAPRAVASAEEALAASARETPDLVLTDLRLPGQSGVELLKELKGRDPFIEVIVLTAFGTVEVAVEAMRAGAFDFLPSRFEWIISRPK